jgi:hypothetical protein
MAQKIDLVNVRVSVNGKEQTIKMEKGTSFENKGGIFTAGESNGVLKMTNYQLKAFEAMANNYAEEGENGIVLSKKDIQEAQQKYRNGGFVADMSVLLPEGYRIEKPKLTSAENMIQAYVTNGKDSQSATLKFSFVDKLTSFANSQTTTTKSTSNNTWKMPATVDEECLKHLDPDGNGLFEFDEDNYEHQILPFKISTYSIDVKVLNEIKNLNGQKITPEFIDKLINKILDIVANDAMCEDLESLVHEGEGCVTTDQPLADISKFAQYLKPETVNRLLKSGSIIYTTDSSTHPDPGEQYFKNIGNLYSRLNAQQKELYYQKILSPDENHQMNISYDWQASGEHVAALIYEVPLSSSTYTKLKNLVVTMNEPNDIMYTKTQCKALINALLSKKQINEQQANELLKAGNIQ